MKEFVRQAATGLRVMLVFTVLLGVIYPLGVWLVSRAPGLRANAEGSVITRGDTTVGSRLIGVDPVFTGPPREDPWFHTRPSAGAGAPLGPGDPAVSGASNRGGFDETLLATVRERQSSIAARETVPADAVPADAVTASASGVDPGISPAYAELQAPRVAGNTGVPEWRVRELIERNTTGGIGPQTVTVLPLNLDVLDAASGR